MFFLPSLFSKVSTFSSYTLIRVGPSARVNRAEMQDGSGVSAAPPQLLKDAPGTTNDWHVLQIRTAPPSGGHLCT